MVRLFAALVTLLIAGAAWAEEGTYHAPHTEWGDPDLRGTWPIQHVWDAGIPFERPEGAGEGRRVDDEAFAERLAKAERSDAEYAADLQTSGTAGLAEWVRSSATGRRNSLLVDPPDGRLPSLTPEAQALFDAGRSSYKEGWTRSDWVSDMDAFERCITRGFPAMMLPKPYNNGVRIF